MSPENRRSKELLPKAGRGKETQNPYLATLILGVATAAMTACTVEDTDRFEGNSTMQYRNDSADAGINTSDVSELQTTAFASTSTAADDRAIVGLDCQFDLMPDVVRDASQGYTNVPGFQSRVFYFSSSSDIPFNPLFPVMLPLDYESETYRRETHNSNGVTYTEGVGTITQEQVSEYRFDEALDSLQTLYFEGRFLKGGGLGLSGAGTVDFPRENAPFYIGRSEGTLYTDLPYISVVDGEEVIEFERHILDESPKVQTYSSCTGLAVNVDNEATVDFVVCGGPGITTVYRINADGLLHTEMSMRDAQLNIMDRDGAFFKFTRSAEPFVGDKVWVGAGGALIPGYTVNIYNCTASFVPSDVEPVPDTGTPDVETTPDTSPDVELEVESDVQPEVDSTDTTPEADTETDTPQDVEPTPDTGPDIRPDVESDAGTDSTDTTPEEDTEADAETDTPQDVEPTPDTTPDVEPEVTLDAAAETDLTDTSLVEQDPPSQQSVPVKGADGCAAGPKNSSPKGLAGVLIALALVLNRRKKV